MKTSDVYLQVATQINTKLQTAGNWNKIWSAPINVSLNGHLYMGIIHNDVISHPCYDPSGDKVYIQNLSWFKSSDAYYSALFHELVHATGHTARLNRFSADEKDAATKQINYSREEIVAELGAAYLATFADLNPDLTNSAAYIKGWAKCLTENPNWISYAASRAIKACDFILASVAQAELVPEASTEDVPFK